MDVTTQPREAVDRLGKKRNSFTYVDVEDDEMHCTVSELHGDYVNRGLGSASSSPAT